MIKQQLQDAVEENKETLFALSSFLFENPEVMFEEFKAVEQFEKILTERGFTFEKGVAGLDTAFVATGKKKKSKKHPTIAIIAEYDALPEVGHACGHNIIATMALGAFLAISKYADQFDGEVRLIGTPAEEGGGGKITMVEHGIFDDVDAAMMIHPAHLDLRGKDLLAITEMKVVFHGKASHAAVAPHEGINALDACINLFNNVNALRQQLPSDVRIHGIINNGGAKPNIIPEYAEAEFYLRCLDQNFISTLIEKFKACAQAGALAAGATVEFKEGMSYKSLKRLNTFEEAFAVNAQLLGRTLEQSHGGTGSSDIGDLSHTVPAIHPYFFLAPHMLHSREFAAATQTDAGKKTLLDGAKCMAMTAADLLSDAQLLERIKKEFKATS